MDEEGRERNDRRKITICLFLDGEELSAIELSHLEYGEIRSLSLGEALRRMVKKDPRLISNPGLMTLIIGNIKAGRFEVRERIEDKP